MRRLVGVFALACSTLLPSSPAHAAGWTPRAEDYPQTAATRTITIPMSDGVNLKADIFRPADAAGVAVDQRFPVVVTITAYNKGSMDPQLGGSVGGTIAGAPAAYLVKRGYVQLNVDARGTGTSGGAWQVFGPRATPSW